MNKNAKIYIAGHKGMVGSSITRHLVASGFTNLILRTHSELDLTQQLDTENFFAITNPEYVFLAAAKVGGIQANQSYPADFINTNISLQHNVITAAVKHNVKRLLFLGSSCIYPSNCLQPIKEEYLLTGPLEITNRSYAIAKITGIEQCFACNRQYNSKFLGVMPCNLYGPNDNYDAENSHVLPALIRKFHEAKVTKQNTVTLWGSGLPRREFLHVDDLAAACTLLMQLPDASFNQLLCQNTDSLPIINVGSGADLTIKELAKIVKNIVGFSGDIIWNQNKPDGTLQKLLDITKIITLGWSPTISLETGISKTYSEYLSKLSYY